MKHVLATVCSAAALAVVGAASAAASTITLLAPWGQAAYESGVITLTYSVSGSRNVPVAAVDAAEAAAGQWAAQLLAWSGGRFVVTATSPDEAMVPITLRNGGGKIAGMTKLSYDRRHFIERVRVQVSGSSYGLANEPATVQEITLHELGHALVGLGHSDDVNDLMWPSLNGVLTIGACEQAGYDALYEWLPTGIPTLPSSQSVSCILG